jgi:hypothetical protein
MKPAGRLALCGVALAAGSVAALAQSAISARSGMIHYVEGQVYLGDQLIESKFGSFPEVKENQQLRTTQGRAEVLLTPGVFLRLGEDSSFRMVTNRLIDTRLELLSGSAVVEAADIPKDNSVTVVYKDAAVHFTKKGIYRFDSTPGQLRIYDGEAEITAGGKTVDVKEGRLVALDTLATSKFDKNVGDALNRWSERRAEYISMANVSAANSLRTASLYGGSGAYGGYGGLGDYGMYGGYGPYGGYGMYGGMASGWFYNPYFGMFTFVPGMMGGAFYSPYGYRLWSPYDVYMAYMPGLYYGYGGYGRGYYGGGGGGYGRAYNNAGYRTSVPAQATVARTSSGVARSGATGRGGSGGSGISGGRSSGISSGGAVSRGGGSGGGHR